MPMNPPTVLSLLTTRLPVRRWRTPVLVVAAVVAAWLVGWYSVTRSPMLLAGALVAVPVAAAVLRDLRIALVGTIAVIALLPFGVLPLRLGAAPTLLELALLMTLGGWLARRVATGRGPIRLTVVGPWILLFQATLIAAQIATLAQSGSLSDVRMIFKLELAILFFFLCASLTSHHWQRLLIRSLVVIGACEALIALVLFLAPRELALRALVRLGPLGYPTDSTVLRYLPDTDRLRATGTAIDPNVLGALLMIVGIIVLTQLLASEPVLPRPWLIVAAMVVLPALLVTFSRSSWLGLAAGVGLTALVRYRRLLPLLGAVAVAFALWPTTQRYALHLLSGLRAQDRAAAMRLGELENAWQIIQAYPWLGIGFGDAPMTHQSCTTPGTIRAALECHTMTLYPGVSNVFLTIAEQAGLIGMVAYVAALAVALGTATTLWWRHRAAPGADLVLSVLAALAGALVASMLDHHFARLPHLVALFWGMTGLALAAAYDLSASPGGPHPGPLLGREEDGPTPRPPPSREGTAGRRRGSPPYGSSAMPEDGTSLPWSFAPGEGQGGGRNSPAHDDGQ